MMDESEFIVKMLESLKSDIEQGTIDVRTNDGNTTQWHGSNGSTAWYSYPPLTSIAPINISPCLQQTQATIVNYKTCQSELQSTNTFTTDPRFVYILGAPTSPAQKLNEEPMTFLNQGQSYEMELTCMNTPPEYSSLKSVIRVTFNDRRLQFMEKEHLQVWKTERHPTEKLIEIDIPLCYGISCSAADDTLSDLNSLEFFWDCHQRATVGVKLNCVSTEFTARKCGGERGVPLRIQMDTYGLMHPSFEATTGKQLLHSAYCLVKVFKPKGAERKWKNDTEWFNRLPPAKQKSYRPSLQKTALIEMSQEEVLKYQNKVSSMSLSSTMSCSSQNYLQNPLISTTKLNSSTLHLESSSSEIQPQFSKSFYLCEDVTQEEVLQWMRLNQFDGFIDTLNKYSACDLLRLSRQDFIDICGVAEGIRFSNAIHRRPVRPKLSLYVCSQGVDCESDFCNREKRIERHGSIDSFDLSPAGSLSSASSTGSVLNGTSTNGSLSPSFGSCFGSTVDVSTVAGSSQKQKRTEKRRIDSVEDSYSNRSKRGCCHRDIATNNVYDLVSLDTLTRNHLVERLAVLYGLQPSRISEIYLQNAKGLTVDLTDLVVEHFEDESHYKLEIIHAVVELQPVTVLLLKSVANHQL